MENLHFDLKTQQKCYTQTYIYKTYEIYIPVFPEFPKSAHSQFHQFYFLVPT